MVVKDPNAILHLQGVLQAILKNPENFKDQLTERELRVVERYRKEADNTAVVGELPKEHGPLYLKLVNEIGANIPPAVQKVVSADEERTRRNNHQDQSRAA